jgi:hypothetical protein
MRPFTSGDRVTVIENAHPGVDPSLVGDRDLVRRSLARSACREPLGTAQRLDRLEHLNRCDPPIPPLSTLTVIDVGWVLDDEVAVEPPLEMVKQPRV